MTSGQKIAVSLLSTVLVFAAFAVAAFAGLFSVVEARFYQPVVINSIEQKLTSIDKQQTEYVHSLAERFTAYSSEASVGSYIQPKPLDADVRARTNITGDLFAQTPALRGIRLIDSNGKYIHFSTFSQDVFKKTDSMISYKNYDDLGELPFDTVQSEDSRAGSEAKYKVIRDGDRNRTIYTLPFYDSYQTYRGTLAFYCDPSDFSRFLLSRGVISVNDSGTLVQGGIVYGLPVVGSDIITKSITEKWQQYNSEESTLQNSKKESHNEDIEKIVSDNNGTWILFTRVTADNGNISWVSKDDILVFPPAVRILLLSVVFITLFLIVFLVFNLKHDDMVVIKDRIKQFQLAFITEYMNRKDTDNLNNLPADIASRRQIVNDEVRKSLGHRGKKHSAEVDALLNKSWDEILAALGAKPGMALPASPSSPIANTAELRQMLEEILGSGTVKIQTIAAPSSVRPMPSHAPVTHSAPVHASVSPAAAKPMASAEKADVEEIEPLEEVEEVADAEPVEEVEDAGPVEEVESAEPVEEVTEAEPVEEVEAAEPVEEVAEAEPVEEVESAEPVEEVKDAEPVEEVADAEPVEEVAEAEPVENDEAAEPVEEVEAVEPVEEVESAEPVENVEAAEPVEEVESAEPVEEVAEAEPVEEVEAVEPVEEVESAEPVENVEAAEEVESAEPVEEVAEAEPVEEVEAAKPVEEVAEAEPAEEVEPAEPVEEVESSEPVEKAEAAEPVEEAANAKPAAKKPAVEEESVPVNEFDDNGSVEPSVSADGGVTYDFSEPMTFGEPPRKQYFTPADEHVADDFSVASPNFGFLDNAGDTLFEKAADADTVAEDREQNAGTVVPVENIAEAEPVEDAPETEDVSLSEFGMQNEVPEEKHDDEQTPDEFKEKVEFSSAEPEVMKKKGLLHAAESLDSFVITDDGKPDFSDLDNNEDAESLEPLAETEDSRPFLFTPFAANNDNITELASDSSEAIVKDSDGTYSVSDSIETDDVKIDSAFKKLVESVLK